MEYAFAASLPSALSETVKVSSAGTDASRSEICSFVADLVSESPQGGKFAKKHRARSVSQNLVANQGLIIAASRTQRTLLAKLDPSARARTFTLREALTLAEGLDASAAPGDEDVARRFAAALSARRGLVMPRKRPRFLRAGSDPLDIVDVHQYPDKRHRRALPEIRDEAAALGLAFARFAAL